MPECPDRVCGVCGGKSRTPDVCGNAVSVFSCQATNDEIFSVEEEVFIWDTSGKLLGAPVGLVKRCDSLKWQMGEKTVICHNGASWQMTYSSTGMINYRKEKMLMGTARGARYPIELR